MKKYLFCLPILLFIMLILFSLSTPILPVWTKADQSLPVQVVIDVGHGGEDPGKIGINQALEKDINLAIGLYLKKYLISAGYSAVMTRESDASLADVSAPNQKLSDLKNRVSFIENLAPSLVVSIHQNSYTDKSIQGSQVFHSESSESKSLALGLQEQLKRLLDPFNHRQIKENTNYYLFRHVTCPIVIVECGFLSNYKEANLLITEDYQQKTAWALYMGISQFLKSIE